MATQQEVDDITRKEGRILDQIKVYSQKSEELENLIASYEKVITRATSAIARGETLSPAAQKQYELMSGKLSSIQEQFAATQAKLEPLQAEQGALATQRVELTKQLAPVPNPTPPAVAPESNPATPTSVPDTSVKAKTPEESTNPSSSPTTTSDSLVTTDELGTTVLSADASKVVSNTNGSVYTDELGNMVEYSNPTRSVGNVAKVSAPQTKTAPAAPPKEQKIENDWRFRIQLANKAEYFYNTAQPGDVLYPLKSTKGVVFPYMPTINMAYTANYDQTNIPHTNFKHFQYQNSEVSPITMSAEFTAQDTYEANYMLAVIHFFRSLTKMFYGKDSIPSNGTPPPLCFLSGLGQYQFDMHPVQVASFSYTLPNDVDYIRTGQTKTYNTGGTGPNTFDKKPVSYIPGITRKENNKLPNGAVKGPPKFASLSDIKSSYVPMKIQINLTLNPVVTRYDISNNFSLKDYASGKIYPGRNNKNGGGIW